jgi:hypothetical protein
LPRNLDSVRQNPAVVSQAHATTPRVRIYSRPPNEKFRLSANGFSPTIEPKKGRIVTGSLAEGENEHEIENAECHRNPDDFDRRRGGGDGAKCACGFNNKGGWYR